MKYSRAKKKSAPKTTPSLSPLHRARPRHTRRTETMIIQKELHSKKGVINFLHLILVTSIIPRNYTSLTTVSVDEL